MIIPLAKYLDALMGKHSNTGIRTILSYYAAQIILSLIRYYVKLYTKQTLPKLYYSFAYPHIKYAITS